ncbi:DNA polymerase Y family protein [Sulfurovum mangrovi]|uniref:DNA polymerase Y family protein n=1 Tax=Sulfurovum mangrovi TaxID=2893889 RepID=UPI001E4DFB38|nr:DNA polymerase IV [Sulfurovum mangrovi]UFH60311.1 DNA polymerase IV [Sulfurovum mangrovi]
MMLHLDLDCFFAAAHRIDAPELHGIPIAVGGRSNLSIFDRKKERRYLSAVNGAFTSSILSSNEGKSFEEYFVDPDGRVRGIITTASYEARAYGVKTAMSVAEALRHCPHLTVIPPDYPLYHKLSHQLRVMLEREIPSIEQFSIDEFFGDVSGWIADHEIEAFALALKNKVYKEMKLPISIGVSGSKWIAKLATGFAKPDGIKVVYPGEVDHFIKDIPIEKFPGIGRGYQERLAGRGIRTLGDIKGREALFYSWGKPGKQLYDRVCGIDEEGISVAHAKKSIGIGRTFDPESNRDEIRRRITILCRHLAFLVHKGGHVPTTYALKIRYEYRSKSKGFINANRLFSEQYCKEVMLELFNKIDTHTNHALIQLNLTLSNFAEEKGVTMDLFHYGEDQKASSLTESMQKLREKFGIDIIKSGGEL